MTSIDNEQLVSITGGSPARTPFEHLVHGNLVNAERAVALQKYAFDMGTSIWHSALHPSEAQLYDQRNAIKFYNDVYFGTLKWLAAPYFR